MRKGITIIFLFTAISLFSQEGIYKVFFFDGVVSIRKESQGDWHKISPDNLTLKLTDSLTLQNESIVYLFDSEGNQFYISDQGKYQISKVIDSIESRPGNSIFYQYSYFIWDELNKPHKDIEKYAKRYLADKGGVSRAKAIPIILSPYYGSNIFADQIHFKWNQTKAKEYKLTFLDSNDHGNILFVKTVADTTFNLSTSQSWIPVNGTLFWTVTENQSSTSNLRPIKILGDEEKNIIHKAVLKIEESSTVRNEVFWLGMAGFYEKNTLYELANESYQKAIKLNPKNQVIWEYYRLFLARMGIL